MRNKFLPFLFILSLISTCIEVDISVPSFPQIAQYFNVSEGIVQLTITYNFLGFCLGAMIYGPLSECYGRRKIMLAGNALLLIGALGCVYAPSINFLLITRFIQGIGASTSVVLVFAMIADHYQEDKAIKLIGIMNACLATSMALAPILGGFINQAFGWRGNYGSVAIISFVSWILLLLILPETKKKFDHFDLVKIASDYRKLLLSPVFINTSLVPSLLFAAYMSFIAASSFLYMETFGLSIMSFVLNQTIIVAAFAITSLYSHKIMERLNPHNTVKFGIILCSVGSISLIIASFIAPKSAVLLTLFMSVFCIGFAVCYPTIFSESLNVFPDLRGTASSLIMSMRALLVSIFTGLTSYLYNEQSIIVSFTISLAVFLGFIFTLNLLASGRLLKQEGNVN